MRRKRIFASCLLVAGALSCSSEDPTEAVGGATKTLESVSNVGQLKLADSLNIKLPESFNASASSAALRLSNGKKSRESCRMTNVIKETVREIGMVKSFFCHLEAESDNIEFGKKTRLMMNETQEFARIWVDNSEAGKIIIYMYQDGQLVEKIEIDDVADDGVKGSIQNTHSSEEEGFSWSGSITFDINTTTPGTSVVESKNAYSATSGEESFKRKVTLNLVDDASATSKIELASSGTWEGSTFADRGVGKTNGEYGNVLFESSGTHDSQSYDFTNRGYFYNSGLVVAATASSAFAEGGALHLAKTEIPDYLGDDFAPAAPTGWEGDYEVTVTLNPDSAEHQACDGDQEDTHVNCWDDAVFEEGEPETE